MFNHLGEDCLAGARGTSTTALDLATVASTTWVADGKEMGRHALQNMIRLIQGLDLAIHREKALQRGAQPNRRLSD